MNSKRINSIILSTILCNILLGGAIVFFAYKYVEEKREKLRSEAYSELRQFFESQGKFVMVKYSGEKVGYERGKLPKFIERPNSSFENRRRAEWEERYGNLSKVYNLKPRWISENFIDSDKYWTGWLLYIIESTGDGFEEYQIYPRSVGYYKQKNSCYYSGEPSVQSAVNAAFEFHTQNEKSSYYGKLADIGIFDIINKVRNEYYKMFSYDYNVNWRGKAYADSLMTRSPWNLADGGVYIKKASDQIGDDGGGMHNDDYIFLMQMRFISTLYALIYFCRCAMAIDSIAVHQLRFGDLLFVVNPAGNAITEVTKGVYGMQIDHVGIYVPWFGACGNGCVWEAIPGAGVTVTELADFHHTNCDIHNQSHILAMRITGEWDKRFMVQSFIKYEGFPYDSLYEASDTAIYCSELVQKCYRDKSGVEVFQTIGMEFRNHDGCVPDYWVNLYKKHGKKVPEGEPGSNPGHISRSHRLCMLGWLINGRAERDSWFAQYWKIH